MAFGGQNKECERLVAQLYSPPLPQPTPLQLVALTSASELKPYAKAGASAEKILGVIRRTVVVFSRQKKESERIVSKALQTPPPKKRNKQKKHRFCNKPITVAS